MTLKPEMTIPDCETLRTHVARSECNADRADLSLAAMDCFEAAIGKKELLESDLTTIVLAAGSCYLGPCYIGLELLLRLSSEIPAVESAWRKLAQSKQAHQRRNAIVAVRDERVSFALAQDLVRTAIRDRSAKVRLFAVETVLIRYMNLLLPEISAQARVEKNPEVLASIEWVIQHMRNGVSAPQ